MLHRFSDPSPVAASMDVTAADSATAVTPYNLVLVSEGSDSAQLTAAAVPLTDVHELSQCQSLRVDLAEDGAPIQPISLPLIDCDANATVINTALAEIAEQEIVCGVLYSSTGAGCTVVDHQEWFKGSIPNLFTVTTTSSVLQMTVMTASSPLRGTIASGSRSSASGGGSSGGLIALYAALGVFVFILLILLVGGLIRMCRYPEHYDSDGTGEERARGLARAMLDTVPLVRVGSIEASRQQSIAQRDEETTIEGSQEKKSHAAPPEIGETRSDSGDVRGTNRDVEDKIMSVCDDCVTPGGNPSTSQPTAALLTQPKSAKAFFEAAPSPAIVSAPAPAKVNTYAFNGEVRTPQRTPTTTPGMSPNRTPMFTPGQTPRAISTDCLGNEFPPKYSTDGFPFPIILDNPANMSLETIDEHKAANTSQPNQSNSQLAGPCAGQYATRTPSSPSGGPTGEARFFSECIRRNLELPNHPPLRHQKPSSPASAMNPLQDIATKRNIGTCSDTPGMNTNRKSIGIYVTQNEDLCSICFEKFRAGELLRALPCSHHFHASCVDPWLLKSSSKCPLCRTDLRNCTGDTNRSEGGYDLGHAFYLVKHRMIRCLSETRSSEGGRTATQDEHQSEASAAASAAPVRQTRGAPLLHRSHTTPSRRLFHLLPISPSRVQLPRPTRQHESTGTEAEPSANQAEPSANQVEPSVNQAEPSANQAEPSANQAEPSANQEEPPTKRAGASANTGSGGPASNPDEV